MQFRIETILGGQSPLSHFGSKGQFRASMGIDPAQPIDDADGVFSTVGSGLLRPAAASKISGSTLTRAPIWMKTNPKDSNLYIYDAGSSAYTMSTNNVFTALSDGGSLSGTGNGFEYYDNYHYFSTPTDIYRYGPLNGVPGFSKAWTGFFGKAALTNTTYPTTFKNKLLYPNHPLCRHSDGKLYIGDVVGNQGTISYINTRKTTVEGDTDNSSTASALTVGYGLWPFAIESFGTYLAVAFNEVSISNKRDGRAHFTLWDTTSTAFNLQAWVEFPDPIITAIKNVNGVLYVVSGGYNGRGFRISKYLSGTSFKEVYYSETGEPCLPGAVEAILNTFYVGTHTNVPEADGVLYSTGLQKAALGQGVFSVMRSTGGTSSTSVTAVASFNEGSGTPIEFGFYKPIIGWSQAGDGSTGVSHGIDQQQTTYGNTASVFWSEVFRIGQPFRITRVRIPLAQTLAANMTVTPKLYFDDGVASQALTVINSTNYPNAPESGFGRVANWKVEGAAPGIVNSGQNNFWLELRWTGSALCTVGLPIIIEGDIIPD